MSPAARGSYRYPKLLVDQTPSQSTSHLRDFVEVLQGAFPPCSRGGPIEARSVLPTPTPLRSFRRVHDPNIMCTGNGARVRIPSSVR